MVDRTHRLSLRRASKWAIAALALVAALEPVSSSAQAQAYPSKPIRIVAPYSAGGNVDLNARVLGKKLTESLGQPVIIDNRPGASSIIGTELVARAAPDGYTLLLVGAGGTTHTINPSLFAKLPYDSIRDFTPISLFSRVPMVMVVHPPLPVGSVKELIAIGKAKPGALNAASGGDGTASNLAVQLLMQVSDTKFTLINYKGNAPALADTVAGQTSMMIDTMSTVLPQVKGGKLRALAVTSLERSPLLPEVPTVAESGYPGYEMNVYLGVLGPAGMPRELVAKLQVEIARITRDPETRQYFAAQAVETMSSTPEEFAAFIKADIAKWERVTRQAGIKLQ